MEGRDVRPLASITFAAVIPVLVFVAPGDEQESVQPPLGFFCKAVTCVEKRMRERMERLL